MTIFHAIYYGKTRTRIGNSLLLVWCVVLRHRNTRPLHSTKQRRRAMDIFMPAMQSSERRYVPRGFQKYALLQNILRTQGPEGKNRGRVQLSTSKLEDGRGDTPHGTLGIGPRVIHTRLLAATSQRCYYSDMKDFICERGRKFTGGNRSVNDFIDFAREIKKIRSDEKELPKGRRQNLEMINTHGWSNETYLDVAQRKRERNEWARLKYLPRKE